MLPASQNNQISDSDPHLYLPECIAGLGGHADEVLASNFLPGAHTFSYSSANFDVFTRTRAQLLSEFIQALCDGKKP